MEGKASNIICSCGGRKDENDDSTPPKISFPRPSRKTLLRIRYYEMKVQLGNFWERALIKIDKATFHKFMILQKRLRKEEEEDIEENCLYIVDAFTNTETSTNYYTRPKCKVKARFHQKSLLVFEADDEESELEIGEIRSSTLNRSRRRERSNVAQSYRQTNDNVQRRRRSARTRTRSMNQARSKESLLSFAPAGDTAFNFCKPEVTEEGELENKDDDDFELRDYIEAACQTENVEDLDNIAQLNDLQAVSIPQPTIPDNVVEPKTSTKGLMDRIVGLANRKRRRDIQREDVVLGFNLIPTIGKNVRRKKPDKDEDELVTDPNNMPPREIETTGTNFTRLPLNLTQNAAGYNQNISGTTEVSWRMPNLQGYHTLNSSEVRPRSYDMNYVNNAASSLFQTPKVFQEFAGPSKSTFSPGQDGALSTFNQESLPTKSYSSTIANPLLHQYNLGSWKVKYSQLLGGSEKGRSNNTYETSKLGGDSYSTTDPVYVPQTQFTSKFYSLLQTPS